MFIIIEYDDRETYGNLRIAKAEGEPVLFGSSHTAEQYAKENCSQCYKVVEI